jgi:hypothetical protein
LPSSAASVLAAARRDVSTDLGEQLAGRPDEEVVAASITAARVRISLDVDQGGIHWLQHH